MIMVLNSGLGKFGGVSVDRRTIKTADYRQKFKEADL
jgi:hypothetical protein